MLASEFDSHAYLLERWDGYDIRSSIRAFYNDLSRTYFYIKWRRRGVIITLEEFSECIAVKKTIERVLLEYLRLMIHKTLGKPKDTRIVGQKSPHLMYKIAELDSHYPRAKYIHIVRDVRNCAESSRRAWGTNIYRYSQRWYDRVKLVEDTLSDSVFSGRKLTILFEALIRNPVGEVRRLCDFLDVEFEPDMCELETPTEYYGDASAYSGIMPQDHNKYIDRLTRQEIMKIESITYPLLDAFGYGYQYRGRVQRLSGTYMRVAQLMDVVNRLIFDIRELGIRNLGRIVKQKFAHFRK